MQNEGKIHLYYGDGKGKTTAAFGLGLRALGCGKSVAAVQFLKQKPSGEVRICCTLERFRYFGGMPCEKFTFQMTQEEQSDAAAHLSKLLAQGIAAAQVHDMLILDEVLDAYMLDMIPKAMLLDFLDHPPAGLEIVLTGHEMPQELSMRADYVTQMHSEKHPYETGLAAREGIEY